MRKMLLTLALLAAGAPILRAADRPNIILIMADDLGYSDIGCYGGEIDTPNLDRLAAEGIRFTQFYNNSKCTQTRAALLSGLYHHQTRNLARKNHVTIAEVLRASGYRTLMSGKWHLPGKPTDRGFDRYFGFLNGAVNFWTGVPCGRGKEPRFRLDGEKYTVPAEGFYTTDAFTDYAVEFVEEAVELEKPFFLYLAHNAPHYPLHAWPEDIAKYRGRYRKGWDAVRRERRERMIRLGVISESRGLSERDPKVPSWDDVDEARRDEQDLLMAVYAAMVDRLDQNIGRLMRKLDQLGVDENTLVLFFSDNGGCPYQNEEKPNSIPGGPESHRTYNSPWANASNTPLRLYKRYAHEGGVSTPLIARWPRVIRRGGGITNAVGHVIDLMPTCVELAGATYPSTRDGFDVLPMEGSSLVAILRGDSAARSRTERSDALYWEFMGHHAVRSGDWKLVAERGLDWALYDIVEDRCEEHDLAAAKPEVVERLAEKYDSWARRVGAVPHAQALDSGIMKMKDYTRELVTEKSH